MKGADNVGADTRRRNEEEDKHDGRLRWVDREVKQRIASYYQRYVVELILQQKPLPPSKNGRHVPLRIELDQPLLDERRGHAYISNSIRSSRYTIWDFLPKQFLFQATRLSNFYFICIGVPQTIPGLSTTGNYTTILPLTFFMLLTVLKEGYDDYRRHRLDKVENNNLTTVLRPKCLDPAMKTYAMRLSLACVAFVNRLKRLANRKISTSQTMELENFGEDERSGWAKERWHNVKVGDILKLRRDDPVPADMILLSAEAEHGVAYIETMALDGETSLKSKHALPDLMNACHSIGQIRSCNAHFVLEDPNRDLYDFNGKVTINDKTLPLTLNEVIYRGSIIRNTASVLGLVINTGEECKIRMNANHHPKAKKPRLESYANQVVLLLIGYVVILSVGVSIGYLIWHNNFETGAWYLNDAYVSFKQIIIGYLIMFNNVIPLALYVSLEIVKIGQMLMVQSDAEMFDDESNQPMKCNTNTILENLGQISYVLSDKTGTLTENVMRFRGVSIGGLVWLHNMGVSSEEVVTATKVDTHGVGKLDSRHAPAGIVVQEREIGPSQTRQRISQPRMSAQISVRRSIHGPRHTAARRSTKDLIETIRRDPQSAIARQAHEFILGMALCHTALPEGDPDDLGFQASSPDELALLQAAQDLGYLMVQRSSQKIELLVQMSDRSQLRQSYEILDLIEFSSKRKRMSIVVRCPDGRIWLLCKGADSVIIPRLKQAELATRKSTEVRRSMDVERRLQRKSEQHEPRNSFGGRPSMNIRSTSSLDVRGSMDIRRIGRTTLEVPRASHEPRHSLHQDIKGLEGLSDEELFTRCFRHLDDFATEGLRTLLFAHRYMDEEEYRAWKKLHTEATTSLVQRQERIEATGELIEQAFELLGGSAIEDRLQKGVPETIDRLRRANVRIWMLTGDKRETAINIAHAAGICRPASLIYILDVEKGDIDNQISNILQEHDFHRVVVIDGHTLATVQDDPALTHLFFGRLISNIDSVIVCRASPAQKADIVRGIRARLPGLTLAIGDGANDIAMIQAAHVGVGISGKEGLQAARVADYSIAQFRFLQRLVLVHGRYQYVRTAKFVLLTFWKEMFFYMMQALYQRYNGYTGTSLYESWSLTVLNTLFTSLCVIIPGIFEQDLRPDTLLAVPELYTYGQRNFGLNLPKYVAWVVLAVVDGMIVWFVSWASYGKFTVMGDSGLFALGDLCFSLGILWTNWKIFMIETHYKTIIVGASFAITIIGWWVWNVFMAGVYMNNLSPYDVKYGFTKTFGTEWSWWLTLIVALVMLGTLELVYLSVKRRLLAARLWPPWKPLTWHRDRNAEDMELELWQEMERDPTIRERLRKLANGEDDDETEDDIEVGVDSHPRGSAVKL